MMRPDAKVEKVYLYPKPVDFRKSIDGLAALVELDIKVAVFDPVLFVFLNKSRNRVKILYWERNGFCLWLKRLEAERFKSHPEPGEDAIVLTAQELNWLLDGIDLSAFCKVVVASAVFLMPLFSVPVAVSLG
ncbi:IS66 family insertion sequence element accessory protein TnpB [Pseudomonas sp. CC6-YY-74]|uniref:IS66 family insertion sequence element accessory protein TnpB n=1 Tax=Pseudomonas sp. CC6-YY-74 TaxID=1930532 RepID=UPI00211430B7|nr:IS66 family insertion sequence element accessory protein TnpB [Pseudomonas sp. CC6-YY-74]